MTKIAPLRPGGQQPYNGACGEAVAGPLLRICLACSTQFADTSSQMYFTITIIFTCFHNFGPRSGSYPTPVFQCP